MYNKFIVTDITTVPFDKKILIQFSFELDKTSVDVNTVSVSTLDGEHTEFKYFIDKDQIIISLIEWPRVNTFYNVIVDGTIKNIVGTKLESSIRKKVIFRTNIKAKAEIISPFTFEKVNEIKLVLSDNEDINSYYVEIADNQKFYDCVYKENVFKRDVNLTIPGLKAGQYFIRTRCQKGKDFGPWSKITTFVYKEACQEDYPEEDGPSADASVPSAWDELYNTGKISLNENGEIVPKSEIASLPPSIDIEDMLEVVTAPENGITPKTFIFEFDRNLDVDFGEVMIIKKDF